MATNWPRGLSGELGHAFRKVPRGFVAVLHQDPGVDPEDLVVGQVWVPVPNNPDANRYLTLPQRSALMRSVPDQLTLMPGVQHTALGSSADVPLLNFANSSLPLSLTLAR